MVLHSGIQSSDTDLGSHGQALRKARKDKELHRSGLGPERGPCLYLTLKRRVQDHDLLAAVMLAERCS